MYSTMELGPVLHAKVPSFQLGNYKGKFYTLESLMGANGVILGFIGDIWKPTSVRRILWLQRHVSKFALMGAPIALMVRDQASTLYGFHMSSPLPVPFPILADEDGMIHMKYAMDRHAGLLLVDRHQMLRHKWLMPDERVWPRMADMVRAVQQLQD